MPRSNPTAYDLATPVTQNVRDHVTTLVTAIEDIDANGTFHTAYGGASTLDALTDVVIGTPSTGQVLKYNGTNWVPDTDQTSGGAVGSVTVSAAAPVSPVANQLWLDSDDDVLYRRNAANTAWQYTGNEFGTLNVRSFGAVGGGVIDDTAAFQAAIAYADAQTAYGYYMYVPAGDYKIMSTLSWSDKIMGWVGGSGGRTTGLGARLSWFGPAGGSMIQTEITGANLHGRSFQRLALRSADNLAKAAIGLEIRDRLDSFAMIEECGFSDFTDYGVKVANGAINFQMRRFRADGIGKYAVYFKQTGSDFISIDDWTIDNDPAAGFTGGAGGAIHFDCTAWTQGALHFRMVGTNFEFQQNFLTPATNAMVKIEIDPAAGGRPTVEGVWMHAMNSGAVATATNPTLRVIPPSDDVRLEIIDVSAPGGIVGIPSWAGAAIGSGGYIGHASLGNFSNKVGDFPSGSRGAALVVSGELNLLQGPMLQNGQESRIPYYVTPAALAAANPGATVYKGQEFFDGAALVAAATALDRIICTSDGTVGTLTGVTATTTVGSSLVTMNTTTGLRKGQYLTIAGVTGTYTIRHINATTGVVTMNTTTPTAVTGAAVAYSAPTYRKQAVTLAAYP